MASNVVCTRIGGTTWRICSIPMGKTRTKSAWIWLILLAALLILGSQWISGRHFFSRQQVESPQDRFLRAVYVLQTLGGPAAAEDILIPGRLKTSDAAESLRHHPDKVFVLRSLAAELASLKGEIPKAALFEAYARVDLGDLEQARKLLSAYVAEYPYRAGQYALLCSLLEELREYDALLLICAEWRERDPACRADRLASTWLALCGLGRFSEAKDLMLRDGNCLEWRRYFYAARAALAAGEQDEGARLGEIAAREAPSRADGEALRLRLQAMDFQGR